MPRLGWLAFASFVFAACMAGLAMGCSGAVLPVGIEDLGEDTDGGADSALVDAGSHRDATSPPDAPRGDVVTDDADASRARDASDAGERDDENAGDANAPSDARADAPDDVAAVDSDATTDAVQDDVLEGGGPSDGTIPDARDDVADAIQLDASGDAIDEPLDAGSDTSTNGGDAGTYELSFTISGLVSGETAMVYDNGTMPVTVNHDGTYPLAAGLATGTSYDVTVVAGVVSAESCAVTSGTGTIGISDVLVTIVCQPLYSITVNVSGFSASANETVTIFNNGANPTMVTGATTFAFPSQANQTAYNITTSQSQATSVGFECVVPEGTGTITGSNVVVTVLCGEQVTVNVTGLISGNGLTVADMQPSGVQDSLLVTGDGPSTLPLPAAEGAPYDVMITQQPNNPPETCLITGGTPSGSAAMPSLGGIIVTISCGYVITLDVMVFTASSPETFTDGANAGTVTVTGPGNYPFPPLPTGTSYEIRANTVAGTTCTVMGGGPATLTGNVTVYASCF